jgi:NADPH:quinone reductase-like Zn-dependent oxidoreductase
MKAVVLSEYGDASKLEVREVPDPKPGPGQIAVRVAAASLNPIDWKLRGGAHHAYMPLTLPAILGKDASGEVIEVGAGVTAFKPGMRVLGRVEAAYAERVVGPADGWAELPSGLDLVDAAALPLVVLTGAQLIEETVGVREGQRVLVTGALGSVGRVAVHVAKARGARVIAGVRAAQKHAAGTLGADELVALDDDDDLAKLGEVDAIADTVGGPAVDRVLGKVKAGGTVGTVLGPPAGAAARGLVARSMLTHFDSKRLGQLARAVADGKLVVPIAKRFPLTQAAEAHRFAEEGHPGGKVLLVVG